LGHLALRPLDPQYRLRQNGPNAVRSDVHAVRYAMSGIGWYVRGMTAFSGQAGATGTLYSAIAVIVLPAVSHIWHARRQSFGRLSLSAYRPQHPIS
jgi:hypothetical protein